MEKINVLFVCMGNICRSPTAEGVFKKVLAEQGLSEFFNVDSAGTHAYHVGAAPDGRAQKAALNRGVELAHLKARRFNDADFIEFDYILAMDDDNVAALNAECPDEYKGKIEYLLSYAPQLKVREVPDPYYGGARGFERVLDMVEAAAEGFLSRLRATGRLPSLRSASGIVSRTVDYADGHVPLQGYFAVDSNAQGLRPAVLVCHAWGGRDGFANGKAEQLAALGYIGFALDMYGKGVLGTSSEENGRLMQPFLDDRVMLQRRITAALTTVKSLPGVDAGKIAAIGFCFGGLCVLDLARTGVEIAGVVSFHGLLGAPGNLSGRVIAAKVLALHGHDDPMVPPAQVLAFQQEMTAAQADWQMHVYGNTVHAFTNPVANNPSFGTVYQADADRRSWLALQNFLAEIFA